MSALCFIDTETTGVHPDRRAWEIAMIRRDDEGQAEWVLQVTDVDLSKADPFGLKVGGFYERSIRFKGWGSRTLDEFFPVGSGEATYRNDTEAECAHVVEGVTRGAHLVGAVPDFDARTLDPMLRRHRLIPAWHYHLIDVEAMAVGWIAGQTENADGAPIVKVPWKSDELSRACGVEPPADDERHTALGDARWAMRWYDAMTGSDA